MKYKLRMMRIRVLLLLPFVFACSSASVRPTAGTGEHPSLETIVIMGTNDLHGAMAPVTLKTRDAQPIEYRAGGISWLTSYAKQLRSELGSRFLWLDGGDQFQGSIESNLEEGAPVVQYFNLSGLQSAAVGNHEFDFGVAALKSRMSEADYQYLAANIYQKGTERLASFPNTLPSYVVRAGALQVGVIGLSTIDTPKTTQARNVKDYDFGDLKTATQREAAALRARGAQIVVITAHAGLVCPLPAKEYPVHRLRKRGEAQTRCNENDEMVELLRSLPAGTVDAVVAGHTHQIVHHFIHGVPVIEGGAFGRYFNLIYLTYDWNQKRVLRDRTRIEGPVPVCPAVFRNQGDCNGERERPAGGRGPLVPPRFHGKEIVADAEVEKLLVPVLERSDRLKKQVVGRAVRPLDHVRMGESPLGNLVADATKAATGADIGLVNNGGLRAPIGAGSILYEDVFRSMPFDNTLITLRIKGSELMTLMRIALSGSRGFMCFSGLRAKVLQSDKKAPSTDLNGDGRIESWEINRLAELTLADGSPIDPEREYTLTTIDFLVNGGDDVGWLLKQIPDDRRDPSSVLLRDAVVKYLGKNSPVNTASSPLIDPIHPRLSFVLHL